MIPDAISYADNVNVRKNFSSRVIRACMFISSWSCALDKLDSGVRSRTCKLHARSAQHRYPLEPPPGCGKSIVAALVPRCHVLQKSQVIGLDLPVFVSIIRLPLSKANTERVPSSSISSTPSLPLLVKTASISRSAQPGTSLGTYRISRISRGFIRRSFKRSASVSRSSCFTLPQYHRREHWRTRPLLQNIQ